ncbi:MAG: VWA domain-containing protein [Verrucomicrobiota bacterium]
MTGAFTNPHFGAPVWLWVALIAPLLLGLLQLYASRVRRRQLTRLAVPEALKVMLSSHSPARRCIKHGLQIMMVFVFGLALARPQWGEQTEQAESLGEDVVFLLDCSRSMLATDVSPNRLTRAKLAIQEFVQHFGRGRVSLVAFAGQAFLQCPLTFDYEEFRDALQAVDERTIPVPGTDIGRALNEGFSAVEKNGRRKILILVSDGEDLEKASVARAKELAAKNVIIFTVGVGTPTGSEIFVTSAAGGREILRNEQEQPVLSRLDEPTLRAIAEVTHGSYQPLGTLSDGLEHVRLALEGAEGFARLVTTRREGVDHFHIPVGLLLILMIGESLLGTRRREQKNVALQRHPAPGLQASIVIVFGCVLAAQGAGKGTELSRSPRTLFNCGTQSLREGRWREAEAAINAAVTSNDATVQPLALYNLGQVRFRAAQEVLKGTPTAGDLETRSEQGILSADSAIKTADAALAGSDLRAAVSAYRMGRATVKSLRQTLDAVKGSADTYGMVLQRWQRAADDFKSALELRIGYENARINAGIVDLHIEELTKERWKIQEIRDAVDAKKMELQQRLDALKRRLPPEESRGEHGADDDASKDPSQSSKPDEQEHKGENGKEMVLTPEEAMRLLSSLRLDLSRQYSTGNLPNDRQNRAGRTW